MTLIGKTAEVRLRAFPPDAAEVGALLSQHGFPAVLANCLFSNSRLVMLMELAAARLMSARLSDEESSVSVEMNLTHRVAHADGGLRAVANCLGHSGRLYYFRVHAFDESGLIATAEHVRAVVVPRRLLAGARRRVGRPAMLVNV